MSRAMGQLWPGGGEKRQSILGSVVPPVDGLFIFSPQKNLKRASAEQLSQLQKCLEGGVVRGVWRREAGEINLAPTGKWTQNSCCVYLRRQMDVEPGFLGDP